MTMNPHHGIEMELLSRSPSGRPTRRTRTTR